MMMRMVGSSMHYIKIFRAVVVFNSVNVMNYFVFCNWPTEFIRHYKDMLTHKPALVGIWMTRNLYENVARFFGCVTSTLVTWVCCTYPRSFRSTHMLCYLSHRVRVWQ